MQINVVLSPLTLLANFVERGYTDWRKLGLGVLKR